MGKPTGFLESPRRGPTRRPVELRLSDWREVYLDQDPALTREQASRCMDCGIPFCHAACPLGNLIPEWNDLVYREEPAVALERLHATNNFPEFTGRLCPAPCESACVLAITEQPVTIERIEYEIIERGYAEGLVRPRPPALESGRRVAVVGSGPAGLAAAQQLRRAGHAVSVYERAEQIGGLLRLGIPEFKMQKAVLDRRLDQMEAEGVDFRPGVTVGDGGTSLEDLRRSHDAVVLAVGSTRPRDIVVPGRELEGVLFAMDYLPAGNRAALGAELPPHLSATGRDVVILGGGDTGADCLGTALRQGARRVTQLEIMARPPDERPSSQPWPTMPLVFKVTSAHEEGGERQFSIETTAFLGDGSGRVRALQVRHLDREPGPPDAHEEIPADLVLIAAGFVGPELATLGDGLAAAATPRGTVAVDAQWLALSGEPHRAPVFAAGDAVRGQSLIVWAIAEGRAVAAAVDAHLCGHTQLPSPVTPGYNPWAG